MQLIEERRRFQMLPQGRRSAGRRNIAATATPRFKLVDVPDFDPPVTNPIALLSGFDVAIDRDEPGDGLEGRGRPFGHLDVRVDIKEVFDTKVTVIVAFSSGTGAATGTTSIAPP